MNNILLLRQKYLAIGTNAFSSSIFFLFKILKSIYLLWDQITLRHCTTLSNENPVKFECQHLYLLIWFSKAVYVHDSKRANENDAISYIITYLKLITADNNILSTIIIHTYLFIVYYTFLYITLESKKHINNKKMASRKNSFVHVAQFIFLGAIKKYKK